MSSEVKGAAVADEVVVSESHYHSKKDRVFVRAIAGPYNLKDELARLRAMPRVRKGRLIRFNDPDRLEMFNLSAAMGPRWAQICTEFVEKMRALGPSPIHAAKRSALTVPAGGAVRLRSLTALRMTT